MLKLELMKMLLKNYFKKFMNVSDRNTSCSILFSANYLVQNNRSDIDRFDLLELQKKNGTDIGI